MPGWLKPIYRWVICETGFGQGEHRVTGVHIIHDVLRRQCSCANTVVILKSWKDDPQQLAERIKNQVPEEIDPQIVIIGYSYGGYSSVLLCKELQKRALSVEHLLLCDAVWRSKFMIGYPLSLTDFFTIHIPGNVRNLYCWRQKANIPKGSKLKLEKPFDPETGTGTIWDMQKYDTVLPDVHHEHIDDFRSFKLKAMEVACPQHSTAKLVRMAEQKKEE